MGLFGEKKIHAFGLDISESSVKLTDLKLHRGQPPQTRFADVPLLDKTIVNHVIVDAERLAGNIRHAMETAKNIDTDFVICAVPEAKSFIRIVSLPKMEESEIEGALPYEIEQDIPIPISEVYMDWQILPGATDKMEVLVTASSKDYIDNLIETLHRAKLKPVAMEIASQATARALIGAADAGRSVLIADIGAKQTSFIIVDHGLPFYSSSIPIAGNSFTESVSRAFEVTWEQAEKIKLTSGLISEADQDGDLRRAMLPLLDNIIEEIKNVIRFFEEHSSNHRSIDAMVLCGGSVRIPGVLEYIQARINLGTTRAPLRVVVGNPWSQIPNSGEIITSIKPEMGLQYATAIGLALRGAEMTPDI